jgi:Tol biopolymer transport system component
MPDKGVLVGSHENAYSTQHLYLVDREGKHLLQLAHDPRYTEASPSWSKDGKWIYFVRYHVQGEVKSAGVWRIRPNGKEEAFVRNLPKTEDLP